MRLLERTIKALRFHRWLYLISGAIAFGFTLISVCLLTASHLNYTSQTGFNQRLSQFDPAALSSASALLAQIHSAYNTVADQYQLWWWVGLGILATITTIVTIATVRHRRQETMTYLAIGKHPINISAQYLLESTLVFVGGFIVAITGLLCFSQALDHRLLSLNTELLDQALRAQPRTPNYAKTATQLFAHQMTDFSSSSLIFNHRYPRLLPTQLIGGAATLKWGLVAVLATQAVVYSLSIWWQRQRLARHH